MIALVLAASCSDAASDACDQEGTVQCLGIGEGRTCAGGTWQKLVDGPCDPRDPTRGPDAAPPSPDAAPPDARADAAPDAAVDAAPHAPDGGACPPDGLAALGTPCSPEGRFCAATDCTDPCKFCNVIQCRGGVWARVEVPPAPCDAAGGG